MRSSVLLALASGLLTHALPTGSNTSLNAVNARRQSTPVLPYPAGYSAATCPLGRRPNPYSTLEVPERKKRSLATATRLRRRNDLCKRIANGHINEFLNPIGNTQEVLLIEGATYVFSWAMDSFVSQIKAWRREHDGTFAVIQTTGYNAGVGTMMLNRIVQTAYVHFEFYLDNYGWMSLGGMAAVSGEFVLFQTANGHRNP